MQLFRLDASIRTEGSVSRAVADTVQSTWQAESASPVVVHREVGVTPLPSDAWAKAATAGYLAPEQVTDDVRAAVALAAELADEVVASDAFLFALPMYNFGVAAGFKQWWDLLAADPRFGPGAESPVRGRAATLVVTRGGGYAEGTPRAGWDHGTPWYRRVLADVLGLDLTVIEVELTLAPVTPGMESLVGAAEQLLEQGHASAAEQGKALAAA